MSLLETMWNTVSVCLSRSAENITKAIFIALHKVSHSLESININIITNFDVNLI